MAFSTEEVEREGAKAEAKEAKEEATEVMTAERGACMSLSNGERAARRPARKR